MESGKTAGHGNGRLDVQTARQAKRAGPKLEAGPEASAERSEGTMEARQGRDAAGGSMRHAHDSATGHVSWPGTPMQKRRCSVDLPYRAMNCHGFGVAAPAQPGRRSCRGAKRSAAGMCRRHFPWSASAARSAAGAKSRHQDTAEKRCAAPQGSAPDDTRRDQFAAVIVCNCSITPGSTKTHG